LRFFAPQPEISHGFLARLTQIDYAREMAFIALDTGGEMLGVARLMANPDLDTGEYAVLVRSDVKGRGLGWALMVHLIDWARATGLQTITGDILRENATMVGMARDLGFSVGAAPDDPSILRATLRMTRP
jgi:acetyltransferase